MPVQEGQTLLDVATGTAPAAILATSMVGWGGRVIGIDISPGILQHAKRNIARARLSNAYLQVGDAEYLPFQSNCFDGVLCSSAIVWFPDILRALREWYRVVRPSGWIAFSCFGGPARQTINNLVIQLLRPYGITYPELNTPLNTPEKCREMVRAAGFVQTTVSVAQEQQFTTDPEISFMQAWASGTRFNIHLSDKHIANIRTQYMKQFAQLVRDQAEWNHDYEQYVVAYKL